MSISKEELGRREERARPESILRNFDILSSDSEKLKSLDMENTMLKFLLFVSLAINAYAALNGWGLL